MPEGRQGRLSRAFKKYKAVQIFKPDEGTSYRLDKDALEDIFGQEGIADCPIAIYSIAGAYRTGKSLMLNLFLQLLKSYKSEDWLKNKQSELSQDFAWRGGEERCTAGMWMWNEPFQLKTKDGKKVVLFLIDTQGTFDNQTTMQNNSLIFALSTLISSVQIFNLMRNIQESDLQYLNIFTDYARAAKKDSSDVDDKPFQKLVFLIRDYFNPKFKGLEGGNQVLKKYFTNDNNLEELQTTRNNCLQSFETTECFCASNPGDMTAYRFDDAPPLKFSDFKPQFLDDVNELMHHLFVDNIVPKKVNGKIATASEVINMIIAYGNVFESGKVPEVDSIVTATAKVGLLVTVLKLSDWSYNAIQASSPSYKSPETLKTLFPELKKKALKEFDETPKIGDKKLVKSFRDHLSRLVDQKLEAFKQANSQNLATLRGNIRKDMELTLKIYMKKFQDNIPDDLNPSDFRENQEKFLKEALDFFESKTKDLVIDIVQPFTKTLKSQLRKHFTRFQEREQQLLKEKDIKLSTSVEDSKYLYSRGMEMGCQGKYLEAQNFEDTHRKHNDRALYEFDEFCVESDASMKGRKRKELVQEIAKMKKTYQMANEDNLKTVKVKYEAIPKAITEVKKVYVEAMSKKLNNNWLPMDRFEDAHKESAKEAYSVIPHMQNIAAAQELHKQADISLKVEREKCRSLNEFSRITAIHKMVDQSNVALQFYKEMMKNNIKMANSKFLDDDDLQKYHNAEREKAFEKYENMSEEPKEEFEKIKQTLDRNIQGELTDVQSQNAENKEKAKAEAIDLVEAMKGQYVDDMVKIYSNGYIKEEALKEAHRQMREKAVKDFRNQYKEFPELLDQLKDYLEVSFHVIQKDNEDNKPFFFRRISSLMLGKIFGQKSETNVVAEL